MSDILIKNMKMPKSCPCELVGVGYDMHCTFAYGVPSRVREYYECCEKETRPEWCPIIEVPTPHGRLIDADAIPYIFGSTHATEYDTVTKFVINKLPTIIEAEDGT